MKKIVKLTLMAGSLAMLLGTVACHKLDFKPEGLLLKEDAVKTAEDLQKVLNGAYDQLTWPCSGNGRLFNELMSDNLQKPLNDGLGFRAEVYNRNTNFFNSDVGSLYADFYRAVNRANDVISYAGGEDLKANPLNLAQGDQERFLAEARFIRAVCHFELVKLFGQPYGLNSTEAQSGIIIRKENSLKPLLRNTTQEVYDFIISDLTYAIDHLPATNGFYADIPSARGILARVYFQQNRFKDALDQINQVLATGRYTLSDTINTMLNSRASTEYIFSFASYSNDQRSSGYRDNYRCDLAKPQIALSMEFALSLQKSTDDYRLGFLKLFNAGKSDQFYGLTKFNFDYFTVPYLHLTELILTKAECEAELGQLSDAINDINLIIQRAYGKPINNIGFTVSQSEVLDQIRTQRRYELVGEGDRVQQLKRLGVKGVVATIRDVSWDCTGLMLQFPSTEKSTGFLFNPTSNCN